MHKQTNKQSFAQRVESCGNRK